jgi:hypothetical protein
MKQDTPSPEHDPWLRHLDRWEMRIMKITIIAGLIIFACKLICHELQPARSGPAPTLQEQKTSPHP